MSPEKAEEIVNRYGGAIASLEKGQAVLSIKSLPEHKWRIRLAYFVYVKELVKIGAYDEEVGNMLIHTYALLDTRFHSEAEKINKLHSKYITDEDSRRKLSAYGGPLVGLPSTEAMLELQEYIDDCIKE